MHGFIYLEGDCVKILAYISDLNKNFSPRTTYTEEHLFVFCPHNQYPSNKDGLIAYSSPNTRSLIPSLIIITGIIMGGSVLPHEMLDPHSWTIELLWCLSFACTFPFSSCMSIRFFWPFTCLFPGLVSSLNRASFPICAMKYSSLEAQSIRFSQK